VLFICHKHHQVVSATGRWCKRPLQTTNKILFDEGFAQNHKHKQVSAKRLGHHTQRLQPGDQVAEGAELLRPQAWAYIHILMADELDYGYSPPH
jgi:hypothetical protein